MGKEYTTWAVIREETADRPAYRLWMDQNDCGIFMSEQDADEHARRIRLLKEQMEDPSNALGDGE